MFHAMTFHLRSCRAAAPLLVAAILALSVPAAAYDRVATLRWTEQAGFQLSGFAASFGTTSGQYGETRDLGLPALAADGAYSADVVLDSFTTYHVVLTAYNDSGSSGYSNEIVISALPCDPSFCEDGDSCTADGCAADGCSHVPAPDGTACTGASGTGLCLAGHCQAVQCLEDADCGDGDACNGAEACVGGQCQAGTPPSCTGGTACTVAACDSALGCVVNPKPDGSTCDDGNAGTVNDQCVAGVCTGSAAPSACDPTACNDGNVCTADACGASGCTHAPVADGTLCNDGNANTVSDQCTAGVCVGTLQAVCSGTTCEDGNSCTLDACSDGTCTHVPLADGTSCDDGNRRTWNDRCVTGVCVGTKKNGRHW